VAQGQALARVPGRGQPECQPDRRQADLDDEEGESEDRNPQLIRTLVENVDDDRRNGQGQRQEDMWIRAQAAAQAY